jgi:hypothetical protein
MPYNYLSNIEDRLVDQKIKSFLAEVLEQQYRPYTLDFDSKSFSGDFGVTNSDNSRDVFFIRRGRGGPGFESPLLEVRLVDEDRDIRLGSI